ncbi:hypothetical protein [Rhizobium ruizarguesonis]|uniref:hypothetical protein n=1 Tax=Rhizobium ruizarguesonis TaxID=2081791 RepID=UPI0013EE97A1|nr:hypothetical protein [Rhizobium ruizarguesonis]
MTQALADDVRGGVPVVDVWRRFELPGVIAQHLLGASGYQALYDVLERNGMSPGFTPPEIGWWVLEGQVSAERAAEILGVGIDEIEDLMIRLRHPED